jgi:hypothetical protein
VSLIKHHNFFAFQSLEDHGRDDVQMPILMHVVQLIGGNREDRAQLEVLDPFVIQQVEARQIIGRDVALVVAAALMNATGERVDAGAQINDQIGRR